MERVSKASHAMGCPARPFDGGESVSGTPPAHGICVSGPYREGRAPASHGPWEVCDFSSLGSCRAVGGHWPSPQASSALLCGSFCVIHHVAAAGRGRLHLGPDSRVRVL